MFRRDELEILKEDIENVKVEELIDSHIEALKMIQEHRVQLIDLISAVYEYANEGTVLMEIAEKIDEQV